MILSDQAYRGICAEALSSQACGPARALVRRITDDPEGVKAIYDAIALETARRFVDGRMSFDDADQIANQLYSMMLEDGVEFGFTEYSFPPLAFEVFGAFDAGEFTRRGEDADPVEKYTRPALERILGRVGSD